MRRTRIEQRSNTRLAVELLGGLVAGLAAIALMIAGVTAGRAVVTYAGVAVAHVGV